MQMWTAKIRCNTHASHVATMALFLFQNWPLKQPQCNYFPSNFLGEHAPDPVVLHAYAFMQIHCEQPRNPPSKNSGYVGVMSLYFSCDVVALSQQVNKMLKIIVCIQTMCESLIAESV